MVAWLASIIVIPVRQRFSSGTPRPLPINFAGRRNSSVTPGSIRAGSAIRARICRVPHRSLRMIKVEALASPSSRRLRKWLRDHVPARRAAKVCGPAREAPTIGDPAPMIDSSGSIWLPWYTVWWAHCLHGRSCWYPIGASRPPARRSGDRGTMQRKVNRPKLHSLFTTGDLAATCGEIQERFDPRPPIVLVT